MRLSQLLSTASTPNTRHTHVPVQPEPFIRHNLEKATTFKSFGICLAFDLEHVQWKQEDLTDANEAVCYGIA